MLTSTTLRPARSECIVRACRHSRTPAVRVLAVTRGPLPGKPLKGSGVVQLGAAHKYEATVSRVSDEGTDLTAYMQMLSHDFSILQMPLGAKLTKKGGSYDITVPKIQLLDVWIQPNSHAAVVVQPDVMELTCQECVLDGSKHVIDLKLNDRFNLLVKVRFTWDDGKKSGTPRIMGQASLDVDVDIPFPFSALPRPLLETTGDTAFLATLNIMLNGFVNSLVKDYEQWARNPATRVQRLQRA